MTHRLPLNVIYNATVGVHYKSSAATLYLHHSIRTRAAKPMRKKIWLQLRL